MVTYVISAGTDPVPLIIGLVVGLVGLLIIFVLMIILVLRVVLVRQCKSTPQPPSTQSDGIELNENEAYRNILSDTSQTQVSTLHPNLACRVVQSHKDLSDETDTAWTKDYEVPLSS